MGRKTEGEMLHREKGYREKCVREKRRSPIIDRLHYFICRLYLALNEVIVLEKMRKSP